MNILGLNYFFHDSTASIVSNGNLVVAIEEERLTRNKHTYLFPLHSIKKCLEVAGLSATQIDHIAVSIDPAQHWLAKTLYAIKCGARSPRFIKHELIDAFRKQREFWSWYHSVWGARGPRVHFVNHHVSHIASFLISPFERAALLAVDGSGEWATTWIGVGRGTEMECLGQSFFPHSFGSFYESVTEFCGFRPNYDEGKTMGLAPLGDPQPFYSTVSRMIDVDDSGGVKIDLSFFNYQYLHKQRCSSKFHDVFGLPRKTGEPFEDHHLNAAASFQKVLEEKVLKICRMLRDRTKDDYLVISGGVALNSVMNGRILEEGIFKDLFVIPAAGDNGTGIGASYYVQHKVLGRPRSFVFESPFVGNGYTNAEIKRILDECKLSYREMTDAEVTRAAARLLHEGRILGWFQGRMEIGPRSLGCRSILANPTIKTMKDRVNAEVKHREAFRPFAPSVPFEDRKRYFDIEVGAPFMLNVCPVRMDQRDHLPSITHVDGSARVQTVDAETSPRFHQLLKDFGELSGTPVLLNTSFNIMGEPIVESPLHAVRCFFSTGLDCLVIGNYLIEK